MHGARGLHLLLAGLRVVGALLDAPLGGKDVVMLLLVLDDVGWVLLEELVANHVVRMALLPEA